MGDDQRRWYKIFISLSWEIWLIRGCLYGPDYPGFNEVW
jgi:hypothetical protein